MAILGDELRNGRELLFPALPRAGEAERAELAFDFFIRLNIPRWPGNGYFVRRVLQSCGA
jgi:hypothetical protein